MKNRFLFVTPWLWVLGLLIILFGLSPFSTVRAAGGLAGSGQHSLAVSAEQPFGYAWGANQNGQIGFAPTDENEKSRRYPFQWLLGAAAGSAWIQVASGDWHSVALRADGTVWAWGLNKKGQLGDGTTTDHAEPQPVSGLSGVIAVAAGRHHSLAVTDAGTVWAWGEGDYRQLGNNGVDTALTPGRVQEWVAGTDTQAGYTRDLTGVQAVAASPVHSVALKADGTVWTWGTNTYGQLGIGGTLSKATAQPVGGLPPIQGIAAGGATKEVIQPNGDVQLVTTAYTLAISTTGRVWGWGYNGKCQLGESGAAPQTPLELTTLNQLGDLQALVGGGAHGVALTTDGRVWTWGDNASGQLGDQSAGFRCTPAVVLTDGETISAGAAHTLVTKTDGGVWAWGRNDQGQLGDGRVDDRDTPEPVRGVCGVGQLNVKNPPPAGCSLTLIPAGEGRGTVGEGGDYAAGETVTLTAVAEAGSRFDRWSPSPCASSFVMPAQALTCTATFTRTETATYPVTLTVTGDGNGTVSGAGQYSVGETVTLTAIPDLRNFFPGWSPPPCAPGFTMPANPLTCTATFEPLPNVPLTVVAQGSGTVSGGGQYQVGETITLTATPEGDGLLAGWSPAPCASVFTMPNEPLTCTATFTSGADSTVVALIEGYYQTILGRAPTVTEAANWVQEAARMQNLGVDRAEVFRLMTGQLFTGADYQNRQTSDAQYVADLAQTFWRRALTADETTTWTGQLAAGLPREVVLYHFLFSAEFTTYLESQLGTATSRPEVLTVVDFYRGLLNRLPDNEGFRYWLDRFQTAQCQGAVAVTAEVEAISSQFANSPEYLSRQRPNRDYLQDLYNAFLRRGAEVEGFNWWLNRLDTDDLSREQVRQHFVAAPEFQERVNQIIQQGCIRASFIQVSAGGYHTCGLKTDGTLACWGSNGYGQVTSPPGTFIQISAEGSYTCGIKTDNTVACWGENDEGQANHPSGTFTQVSAGNQHTCGIQTDGTVVCWGANDLGQATPPAGTFTQVSAGFLHTCGIKTDGTLACWGDNWNDQATPPTGSFSQVSTGFGDTCGIKTDGTLACWGFGHATPPIGIFTQISSGFGYTCGIKTDGTVACWGANDTSKATPPTGTFTQVSAGGQHTCGIETDGTVACWGNSDDGQATPPDGLSYRILQVLRTGAGTVTSQPAGIRCGDDCNEQYVDNNTLILLTATADSGVPFSHWSGACSGTAPTCWVPMRGNQQVGAVFGDLTSYAQVSAGGLHTCGLKTDGTLACWGDNGEGQATPPDGTFTQVSTGFWHTCGIKTDGTVACWGSNGDRQTTPLTGVFTQVSAGYGHTCGVQTDGTVACWGSNNSFWGSFIGQATPPPGTFIQVSAGDYHTCGVKSDGTLACWGGSWDGEIGEAMPPAGTFTQVSAGGLHTCGLRSDGTVACWGSNSYGQATPSPGTFTQVSAGFSHTCGIKTDDTVACWGDNDEGQANRPGGIFTQVSAGYSHTCAVKSEGMVVCWGDNGSGQSTPP